MMFDVEHLEQLLIQCAKQGVDISYSEAMVALGSCFTRPKMRQLCRVLGEVDTRAVENGEPELAVLVVRGNDRLPGDGWWSGRTSYRGDWTGEQAVKYIRRIQHKAYKYWQKSV